jgi:hypothetical protein
MDQEQFGNNASTAFGHDACKGMDPPTASMLRMATNIGLPEAVNYTCKNLERKMSTCMAEEEEVDEEARTEGLSMQETMQVEALKMLSETSSESDVNRGGGGNAPSKAGVPRTPIAERRSAEYGCVDEHHPEGESCDFK